MSHDCRAFRFLVGVLGCVLSAWSAPLAAQAGAPVRALPLPSAPAPSLPGAHPLGAPEYRLQGGLWPKDPTLGGLLGGAIGCASGAILGRILSARDRRTRNAWSGCFFLGAVGVGAGSGWRMPGDPYFQPG
jgi:hypothetical protein